MQLPPSARTVLTSGRLAHLVTVNGDGSPQVTCIWVGLDGDTISKFSLYGVRWSEEIAPWERGFMLAGIDKADSGSCTCSEASA